MCSTFGSADPKEDDGNNNPRNADLKDVVNKNDSRQHWERHRKDLPVHLSSL